MYNYLPFSNETINLLLIFDKTHASWIGAQKHHFSFKISFEISFTIFILKQPIFNAVVIKAPSSIYAVSV